MDMNETSRRVRMCLAEAGWPVNVSDTEPIPASYWPQAGFLRAVYRSFALAGAKLGVPICEECYVEQMQRDWHLPLEGCDHS